MKIEATVKIDTIFEIGVTLNNVENNFDIDGFMDALKESVILSWYKTKEEK